MNIVDAKPHLLSSGPSIGDLPATKFASPGTNWLLPAGMLVFCAPAGFALARQHWNSDTGSLTPLILLLGIWTLSRTIQGNIGLAKPGPALITVLAGLFTVALLYLTASAIGIVLLMAVCAWAGCVLAIWSWLGAPLLMACRFPLVFLGLAVPLPYSISVIMAERLRIFMAENAVGMADALGLDIAIDRSNIFVGQYRLAVEAACAGTSSTISLVAFVLLFTYWYSRRDWRRTIVSVLLAIPIALSANVLRVLALIIAVNGFGAPVLNTILHPITGIISFSFALALFLATDRGTRTVLALIDRGRHD